MSVLIHKGDWIHYLLSDQLEFLANDNETELMRKQRKKRLLKLANENINNPKMRHLCIAFLEAARNL